MSDTILAYIISFGLIGAGMGWIIAGPNSPLCTTIGIASIVVGVISVSNEFRHRRGWRKRAVDRLNSFQRRGGEPGGDHFALPRRLKAVAA